MASALCRCPPPLGHVLSRRALGGVEALSYPRAMPARLLSFSVSFALAALILYVLATGRDLLVPLAIAIIIWYLINALATAVGRLRLASWTPPGWLRLTASVAAVVLVLIGMAELISDSFVAVTEAAPRYQANIERLISRVAGLLGVAPPTSIVDLFQEINVQGVIVNFAATAAAVAGNAGIIFIYAAFLLVEQRAFDAKLAAILPDAERQRRIREVLAHIQADIQTYLWIKTLMSLLTGAASYVLLIVVGVDFAAFWAFVIFLLNYVPTVGSILGVVFPALLTLVQFNTLGPFVIVVAGLGFLQFLIGNVLEPRLMGRSLNISPLVVILSLVLWGSIWGVAGMFLCVPITVILMIIAAQIPQTRWIAIALSGTGRIR